MAMSEATQVHKPGRDQVEQSQYLLLLSLVQVPPNGVPLSELREELDELVRRVRKNDKPFALRWSTGAGFKGTLLVFLELGLAETTSSPNEMLFRASDIGTKLLAEEGARVLDPLGCGLVTPQGELQPRPEERVAVA